MRFTLRNQHKIKEAFSETFLNEILEDTKTYFRLQKEIKKYDVGHKFQTIKVPRNKIKGYEHIFYIYDSKYDVLNLAYKETIKTN